MATSEVCRSARNRRLFNLAEVNELLYESDSDNASLSGSDIDQHEYEYSDDQGNDSGTDENISQPGSELPKTMLPSLPQLVNAMYIRRISSLIKVLLIFLIKM